MANLLFSHLQKDSTLAAVERHLQQNEAVSLSGLQVPFMGIVGALWMQKLNRPAIFIVPDEGGAEKIVASLCAFFDQNEIFLLPAQDLLLDHYTAAANDTAHRRLQILSAALDGKVKAMVMTPDGFASLCPSPDDIRDRHLILRAGETLEQQTLLTFLQENGYHRVDMVEGSGTFSVRGSIVDIFDPAYDAPIRVDFFDDQIDLLGFFDSVTQRKTEEPDFIRLGTASARRSESKARKELLQGLYNMKERVKDSALRQSIERDIDLLRHNLPVGGIDRYLPLLHPSLYTPTDFLQNALLFLCESERIKEGFDFLEWQFAEDCKRLMEAGEPMAEGAFFVTFDDLLQKAEETGSVQMSLLSCHAPSTVAYEIRLQHDPLSWKNLQETASEMRRFLKEGYTVFCAAATDSRMQQISEWMHENDIPFIKEKVKQKTVTLLPLSVMGGAALLDSKVVLAGDVVQKKGTRPSRRRTPMGEKIKSYEDINPGDLVVHIHHGIGVYQGIRRIDNHGIIKDYLTISYDKGDTLYIPATQLDMVSKYMGAGENKAVKLSRLGSPQWEKTKQKARAEAEVLAKELIALYAKRLGAEGHAFPADTDWQKQFEDNFPYAETEDQIRCVEEIKTDMQAPHPMDRLLCGDVGFGKTEVALRAVFKAVGDSKQAAILVPTTLLSEQHFQTLTSRFVGFPIRAAVLNRFKSAAAVRETLRALRTGEIDVVIGTHRLLQKDVQFKDLGLLVVDEEQRFGVKHKEAIKELSLGVDVLTLSATPIPRTLNMALSGIRDMSIIEEPPADRHPVSTYVLAYDPTVVIGAIRREMRRHGCVYYVKNDIERLDSIAFRLSEQIPGARIAIAHGQMKGSEIEKIWEDVLAHKVDILLCTTIIETGIDVPFTNTLIIEDADHMGLAQLHQLRGRIGRSNQRAFAYLTYRPDKQPGEIAAKRLTTIREFTEFGSGFKIAMRDLEIRGAGSVLGERQHGHINTVGYDLYMQILAEAVRAQKGELPKKQTECSVDLSLSAFLPETYIEHDESRIDIYKKIAAVSSAEEAADITDELCDRFGEPPQSVQNLISIALLRGSARSVGICDIKQKADRVLLYFEQYDMETLSKTVAHFPRKLLLSIGDKPYITLRLDEGTDILAQIQPILDHLRQ